MTQPPASPSDAPPTVRAGAGVRGRVRGAVWVGALGVAGLAVAAGWAGVDVRGGLREALEWVERLGAWGPVLFVALYAVATVLFLPGSILTLGAGAVFGVVRGSIYVSIGSTLGATGAFLVGRYLARDWVASKIRGHARFEALDRAVAEEGWRVVGLTRLSPVFPFSLLNYALGLTRISLPAYVVASWIGMMPGTVLYVSLGAAARAGAEPAGRSPAQWVLLGAGVLATLAITVILTRLARRTLSGPGGNGR